MIVDSPLPAEPLSVAPDATTVPDQVQPPMPAGDDEIKAALLGALRHHPQTAHELVQSIEAVWPGFFDERAGFVHPLLLALRRDGATITHWESRPAGTRRVEAAAFALAAVAPAIVPDSKSVTSASAAGTSKRLEQAAERATRSLGFAADLQHATRLAILGHLIDDAATRVAGGANAPKAERAALKAFGDPWRVSTDLSRIARGRATVLFPRNFVETLRGALIYDASMLLFIIAAIVFVRLQVVSAYHIPTRSMEPTLHGDEQDGDRILVNRLSGRPERGDIWVFDGWHAERKNFVKRVIGLPGDRLKFREGDLYVNGQLFRKEGDLYDALLFPVYIREQIREQAVEEAGAENPEAAEEVIDEFATRWSWLTGKWTAFASGAFRGHAPDADEDAVLRLADRIQDDYLHPRTGRLNEGLHEVADRRLTSNITPETPATQVTIRMTRGASRYEARLHADGTGVELIVDGEQVARADYGLTSGETSRVRFAAVDHVLRLEVDGELLRHDLAQPEFPGDGEKAGSTEYRIAGGAAHIVPERIERDVFWNRDDEADVEVLGPTDYYMVGDNAGNSQDSRRNGPVHANRLIGSPILVVWPPSRMHIPR